MLIMKLIETGGVDITPSPILQVTDLIELFCVFPEIYNQQYEYPCELPIISMRKGGSLSIHSYMFELYRDINYPLVESRQEKLPLFDALDAYYSLLFLEQARSGKFVPIGLEFDLPIVSFKIVEGEEVTLERVPKTLLNEVNTLKESPQWIYFFNSLEGWKNEIRVKYRNTDS